MFNDWLYAFCHGDVVCEYRFTRLFRTVFCAYLATRLTVHHKANLGSSLLGIGYSLANDSKFCAISICINKNFTR